MSPDLERIAKKGKSAIVFIPENFNAVKRSGIAEAARWRDSSRKALELLFGSGFVAVDFHSGAESYYILSRDDFLPTKMRKNVFV